MESWLRKRLADRIGIEDIREISIMAIRSGEGREALFKLIDDDNTRVGFNALWILSHSVTEEIGWLSERRDYLIDRLLQETHPGKRRLLLRILSGLPIRESDVRSDYLDFCFSRINSTDPYAIRAWSLKQAFAMSRYYPELLAELKIELSILKERGEISAGLLSAVRQVEKRISGLKS